MWKMLIGDWLDLAQLADPFPLHNFQIQSLLSLLGSFIPRSKNLLLQTWLLFDQCCLVNFYKSKIKNATRTIIPLQARHALM